MDAAVPNLADRFEIDELLTRYATAIDNRDWALLDSVFAPDAVLDYRSAGGIAGGREEVVAWLASVLPMFDCTQHLVVNRMVTFDASGARSKAAFLNPNRLTVDGGAWLFTVGGWYHDRLVRRPEGWRILRRVEETLWWEHPMPGLPPVPFPLAEALDF